MRLDLLLLLALLIFDRLFHRSLLHCMIFVQIVMKCSSLGSCSFFLNHPSCSQCFPLSRRGCDGCLQFVSPDCRAIHSTILLFSSTIMLIISYNQLIFVLYPLGYSGYLPKWLLFLPYFHCSFALSISQPQHCSACQ